MYSFGGADQLSIKNRSDKAKTKVLICFILNPPKIHTILKYE